MNIVIDGSGGIVILKRVRERLGLKPGAILELEVRGRVVRLTPIEPEPLFDSGGVLVFCGDLEG